MADVISGGDDETCSRQPTESREQPSREDGRPCQGSTGSARGDPRGSAVMKQEFDMRLSRIRSMAAEYVTKGRAQVEWLARRTDEIFRAAVGQPEHAETRPSVLQARAANEALAE